VGHLCASYCLKKQQCLLNASSVAFRTFLVFCNCREVVEMMPIIFWAHTILPPLTAFAHSNLEQGQTLWPFQILLTGTNYLVPSISLIGS